MKKRKGRAFRWLVFIIDILLAVWITNSAKAAACEADDLPETACYETRNGGEAE